ncbi:MAG: carbohydrate porin [Polyangiaceae bacterium]
MARDPRQDPVGVASPAAFHGRPVRSVLVVAALLTSVPRLSRADDARPPWTRYAFRMPLPPARPGTASPIFHWTGLHVGGHVAAGLGSTRSAFLLPSQTVSTEPLWSLFGGVQVGYDLELAARVVVGVEADISFPYFTNDGVVLSGSSSSHSFTQKLDFISTARGRIGYALDRWLFYGTGGLAWAQARSLMATEASGASNTALNWPTGWTAGAGAELAIAPAWTLRGEYLFERMSDATGLFAAGAGRPSLAADVHSLHLGLNWHFGGLGEPSANLAAAREDWLPRREDWSVHWQATLVEQGYFRFHSPYEGENSLSGDTQFANTVSVTAFLGLRLWDGAQFTFDPEIDQGFGLSQTLGVAAFPNGEAQKAAYAVPRLNVDRVLVRQTFGLGGEQEAVWDEPNQLPERRDIARVTVTAGRLTVGDAFGVNSYAFDPRTQFLNWNIYGSGSYDWTMDKPGFTWGVVTEFNQRAWAVRFGYFLEPTESDGNTFDTHVPTHGQYLVEPEWRYSLFAQPGALRLLAWATQANMGSYADALAMPVTTPEYPDITETRRVRATYGLVANVEQALSRDAGLFSRASWTPGLVEVMGWTDCDESLSLGASFAGSAWRRTDDRLGLAAVIEGLSAEARAYFAAGGLGILIGDGRLHYRPEQALEAYYSLRVASGAALTFDFQLIANPAYNADRGPVPIYAARLHVDR